MAVTTTGPYTVNDDGYTYYKFTGAGSASWTVPADCPGTVDVTVVGGGGGSPSAGWTGGGGGGYMVSRFNQSVSGSVTVVVGAGGPTIAANASNPVTSCYGGQSSFGSITANGGCGFYTTNTGGSNGGSGGGTRGTTVAGGYGGSNGSDGYIGDVSRIPGTGQGTGSTTNNPSPCSGTTGIDGITRCGGGGGVCTGQNTEPYRGLGGSGGGGNGGMASTIVGTNGADGYGGGAGGSYLGGAGVGGSGIVIVRYQPAPRKKGSPAINSAGVMIV